MSAALEITILGCGNPDGVPRADGAWGVCDPNERLNARTRGALLVRRRAAVSADPKVMTTAIVGAPPDFRRQGAQAGVARLDAVLLAHGHASHVNGLDDVRTFFLWQNALIPCWMDRTTSATVRRRFGYMFESAGLWPAICVHRELPRHGEAWRVDGPSGAIPVVTFGQDHESAPSVGYRFGAVAYSSGLARLDGATLDALAGVDTWIVDVPQRRSGLPPTGTDRVLDWVERVKPRRTILVNLGFDLDFASTQAGLPQGVELGFDGLQFLHRLERDSVPHDDETVR